MNAQTIREALKGTRVYYDMKAALSSICYWRYMEQQNEDVNYSALLKHLDKMDCMINPINFLHKDDVRLHYKTNPETNSSKVYDSYSGEIIFEFEH